MNCVHNKTQNSTYQSKISILENNQVSKNKVCLNSTNTRLSRDVVSFRSNNPGNYDYNIYGDKPEEIRQLILPDFKALFKTLPKAELHVHLKGATTLSVIRQELRRKGYGEEEIATATTFPDYFVDLDHFRKTYTRFSKLLITPQEMRDSAYFTCIRAAEDNVRYLELRINPRSKGQNPYNMINMVTEGIRDAQTHLKNGVNFKQIVKLLILAKRDNSQEEVMENAKIAVELAKNPDNLVVGFDIAGAEAHHTILKHEGAIKFVKDKGLHVTVHAGETPTSIDNKYSLTGAQSIRAAVDLDSDRIGHGLHLIDDPELVELVKRKGITIESPPTANVSIKSVRNWKGHPFKQMLDAGVKVAVCTDNPTLFKTTISREYERLYKHSYINSWDTMKTLVMNGINGGFLSLSEKKDLEKDFKAELLKIEKNKYFKDVIKQYLTPEKSAGAFDFILKNLEKLLKGTLK